MLRTLVGAVGLGIATTIYVTRGIDVLTERAATGGVTLSHDEAASLQGVPSATEGGAETLLEFSGATARHVAASINPYHWLLVIGLLLIVTILFLPQGLYGLLEKWRAMLRRGPK